MSASVGWIPGTWRVPVSLQSHAREPPGKSLASLYSPDRAGGGGRVAATASASGARSTRCCWCPWCYRCCCGWCGDCS